MPLRVDKSLKIIGQWRQSSSGMSTTTDRAMLLYAHEYFAQRLERWRARAEEIESWLTDWNKMATATVRRHAYFGIFADKRQFIDLCTNLPGGRDRRR